MRLTTFNGHRKPSSRHSPTATLTWKGHAESVREASWSVLREEELALNQLLAAAEKYPDLRDRHL